MKKPFSILNIIPIARTLDVCTRSSKRSGLTELFWNIGIAIIPIFVIGFAVLFSVPYSQLMQQLISELGHEDAMIYSAAICGPVLYTLRFEMKEPIPDAIAKQITPIGTLVHVV